MENKLTNQSIERLDIKDETIKKIQDEQIYTLGELCRKTKSSLINMKIDKKIVDDIEIQLQLMGLMLKGTL